MNELIKTEQQRASELHGKVMSAREQVTDALCTFAMHLKAMRDEKLYIHLGFEKFDDYAEQGVNINKRQIYNYISTYEKLGSTEMQSNAHLGITKLQLLTEVAGVDRADFATDNDLAGLSVAEIKELIKKSKEQVEQISLLENQLAEKEDTVEDVNATKEAELIEIKNRLRDAETELRLTKIELEEKENEPISVAVEQVSEADIAKIRQEIEAEHKKNENLLRTQAVEDAKKSAQNTYEIKLKEKIKQAKKEVADTYAATIAKIEGELTESKIKAEQTAKLSEVSADADMITANFYIVSISDYFGKLVELIDSIDDTAKADKLWGAAGKLTEIIAEQVKQ